MATDVETLLVRLEARIDDYEKKMARAQRTASSTASKIQSSFGGMSKRMGVALGALGAALSARALTGWVTDSIKAGEAIGDLAEKLGISAEALQEFNYVAEQSGASQESIEAGFRGLAKFMSQVEQGGKRQVAVLQALGLSFANLRQQAPDQVFTTLLDAVGKLENPLQRNAVLMEVFGRAGTQLAQISQLTAKGIDAMRQEARDLGLVLSEEQVKVLQDSGDALAKIGKAAEVAGGAIAVALAPAILQLAEAITSPAFQTTLASVANEVARFITDVNNLINDVQTVINKVSTMTVPGHEFSGQTAPSAIDQPVPFGPGTPFRTADEANAAIQQRAALRQADKQAALDAKAVADANARLSGALIYTGEAASGAADAVVELDEVFVDIGGGGGGGGKSSAEKAAEKIADVNEALAFQYAQLGRTGREQAIYNALNEAGVDISSTAGQAIAAQVAANYDLEQSIARVVERMDLLRDTARTGLGTFVNDLRDGVDAVDALSNAFDRMTDRLVEAGLDAVISGIFGQAGGAGGGLLNAFLGARQAGGPVRAGGSYLVGEGGPELFRPNVSGTIVPGGSGGIRVETHYHNNAGVRVEQREKKDGKGGVRLDVMIDELVASKVGDRSSRTSRALQTRGLPAGRLIGR